MVVLSGGVCGNGDDTEAVVTPWCGGGGCGGVGVLGECRRSICVRRRRIQGIVIDDKGQLLSPSRLLCLRHSKPVRRSNKSLRLCIVVCLCLSMPFSGFPCSSVCVCLWAVDWKSCSGSVRSGR